MGNPGACRSRQAKGVLMTGIDPTWTFIGRLGHYREWLGIIVMHCGQSVSHSPSAKRRISLFAFGYLSAARV